MLQNHGGCSVEAGPSSKSLALGHGFTLVLNNDANVLRAKVQNLLVKGDVERTPMGRSELLRPLIYFKKGWQPQAHA